MSVKIQVLGHGLIPRGYGLAPRKEPFPADPLLIGTILQAGFKVNALNPVTGKFEEMTKKNYRQMYNRLDGAKPVVKQEEKKPEPPVDPNAGKKQQTVVPQRPWNENNSEDEIPAPEVLEEENDLKPVTSEDKDEEKVESSDDLKPVTADDKKEEKLEVEDDSNDLKSVNTDQKAEEKKETVQSGDLKPVNSDSRNNNHQKGKNKNKR